MHELQKLIYTVLLLAYLKAFERIYGHYGPWFMVIPRVKLEAVGCLLDCIHGVSLSVN